MTKLALKSILYYALLLFGWMCLLAALGTMGFAQEIDHNYDPQYVVEVDGKLYRTTFDASGQPIGMRPAEVARFHRAREFPPVAHWGGCPALPPWPAEVLGLWVQDHMDNLHNGRNFPWKWYTGNQSFCSFPVGDPVCSDYGKIGTKLVDQHYLQAVGFEEYPPPAFAGEMSVGDQVWVFYSLNHAGYSVHDGETIGVTCLNNEWNFVGTPLLGWQVATLNVTHPSAPSGTAYTHSALMALDIPDDPDLIGLALYRQAWFLDVSESAWVDAMHGEVILLWE